MYKGLLETLGTINLIVWLIAPLAAFLADRFIRTPVTRGWRIVAAGSFFTILRQLVKLLPGYDTAANPPEVHLAYHTARYVVGEIGALIMLVGVLVLLIDYVRLEAQLGADAQ